MDSGDSSSKSTLPCSSLSCNSKAYSKDMDEEMDKVAFLMLNHINMNLQWKMTETNSMKKAANQKRLMMKLAQRGSTAWTGICLAC